MPFTFAHPAAIIPIRSRFKKWIPLPALVIGSLVPDAAYYLPVPGDFKDHAHTLQGTISFSLPLGIILLLIFYWLAPEIVFLLPSPHREALQPLSKPPAFSISEAGLAVCGIVLGAATHVLWDSFTHSRGWIVERVPLLQQIIPGSRMPVHLALQFLSTLLGLCLLLYFYDRWLHAAGFAPWVWQKPSWRFYLWTAVLGVCFVASVIESHAIHAIANYYWQHSRHFGLILITSFVRNLLIALCVVSVATKLVILYRSKDPAGKGSSR